MFFAGVGAAAGSFQFLLGCYFVSGSAGTTGLPNFQFLLGCYDEEWKVPALGLIVFQFLLGCYFWPA